MGNTLITPDIVAREALMVLENQMVMAGLVHRDYSTEFAKVGDTVTVRKPAVFESKDYAGSITLQDATEGSTSVKLDTHLDVSFAITSKEATLELSDFSEQFIQPAMRAHAQRLDLELCKLYRFIPYYVGAAGTTPDGLDDFTTSRKSLNDRKVPMDSRRMVMDTAAEAKMLLLEAINSAEKSGTTDALRNANMGRIMAFDTFMDQNVVAHDNGDMAVAGAANPLVKGAVAAGAATMNVDGAAGAAITGTIKAGTLFTVANVTGTFTVIEDLAAAANELTGIKFYPAAPTGGFADNAIITIIGDHTANLAFHKNALAMVSRPLELPMGAAKAEVMNYKGMSVRVVYGYDMALKHDVVSLDILCGFKAIYPQLATRLLG